MGQDWLGDFRQSEEKQKARKAGNGSSKSLAFENCSGLTLGLGGSRARKADGTMGFALLQESRKRPNLTTTLANYGREHLKPGFSFTTIQVSTGG
eukprot:COSAG02_NODE_4199_length_5633_cov_4.504518_1_plen_95_part_00